MEDKTCNVQRLGDVNFDYSQIQWQGLWPRPDLLVVLRAQTEERHFFLRQTIIQGSFPRIQGSFSNLHALTPNQELNELPAPSAATAASRAILTAILTAIRYSNSNSNVEVFETP
uniref:Uncharacterized protein n=1 Tax=Vespula pensylvanica TaxID=30213 RepID=A0A834JJC4_VESPE|nr:hypothetical protein H0235_017997 [Vespula pensylvanica]